VEIIISFLRVFIPYILISFVSLFLIRILRIVDFIEKLLLIFLINWFQIILIVEILSLFQKVLPVPLIISHSLVAFICLIISIRRKIIYRISFYKLKENFYNFYNKISLSKVFKIIIIIWILAIIMINFFIGVTVPPKNYDSMTYHLTRVAFWKQNQTINHYFTRNVRQIENPMNAEIGFLWIILFTNSDSIVFIVQWSALLIIIITLYKILRLLSFKREISLITSFVFSTLNMVIFQASSTQNDLLTASFVLLTIYFIFKVIENKKIELKYIILAGLSAGLSIGVKGYTYFFIPGVLLFMIIFRKNSKIKWIKISYIILFSLIGCFLFASYNLVQNYISFGNILGSGATIDMMRINNPSYKTFISNFLRHAVSFYQLRNYDFGIVSLTIEKILNVIHNILGINISSPDTTWAGQKFSLSGFILNMDFAYFGPLCSLVIIPSVIYNGLLFLIFNKYQRSLKLVSKYKNHLKILIIPILFFILYTLIFKWQPWAGRLMISYVSLMMVSFAMFFEFIRELKFRYIFTIITSIIILVAVLVSSKVMLNSWDPRLLPIGGNSIYSVNYDDRRFINSPPYIKEIKKIVEVNIPEEGRMGLITSGDDWDYVYFGKNFKRTLIYISERDFLKENLNDLIFKNKLDGILINTLSVPFIPDESRLENIIMKNIGNYKLFFLK